MSARHHDLLTYRLLNMDLLVAQRRVQDVRDVVVTRTLSAIGVRPCGVESMLEAYGILKVRFVFFIPFFFPLRVLIKAASLSSFESTRGWCLKFAPAPMQGPVPPSTFFLIRAPLRQQVDFALALSRQHLWFVLALGWQRIDLPPRPLTAASRLHA